MPVKHIMQVDVEELKADIASYHERSRKSNCNGLISCDQGSTPIHWNCSVCMYSMPSVEHYCVSSHIKGRRVS